MIGGARRLIGYLRDGNQRQFGSSPCIAISRKAKLIEGMIRFIFIKENTYLFHLAHVNGSFPPKANYFGFVCSPHIWFAKTSIILPLVAISAQVPAGLAIAIGIGFAIDAV
jgi:hypothetical protein